MDLYNEEEANKLWKKMYRLWKEQDVPSIQIMEFDPGKHFIKRPWYNLEKKYQENYGPAPIFDTAYHLVVNLSDAHPELIAAFKIHAFIRNYYNAHILEQPLWLAMKKHSEFTWWNHNARYVLPDSDVDGYRFGCDLEKKDWKKLVPLAAEVWKDISKKRAVIAVPDFLDRGSKEYKKYRKFAEEETENQEYQRFLRLKEKYEGSQTKNKYFLPLTFKSSEIDFHALEIKNCDEFEDLLYKGRWAFAGSEPPSFDAVILRQQINITCYKRNKDGEWNEVTPGYGHLEIVIPGPRRGNVKVIGKSGSGYFEAEFKQGGSGYMIIEK